MPLPSTLRVSPETCICSRADRCMPARWCGQVLTPPLPHGHPLPCNCGLGFLRVLCPPVKRAEEARRPVRETVGSALVLTKQKTMGSSGQGDPLVPCSPGLRLCPPGKGSGSGRPLGSPLCSWAPACPSTGPQAQPGGRWQRAEQPRGGPECGPHACRRADGASGDHLLPPATASRESSQPRPGLAVTQGQTGGQAPRAREETCPGLHTTHPPHPPRRSH